MAPVTLATRADEAGGPPPSKFYERRDNLVGVGHVEQYAVGNYSAIPTIGTLFLVNFVSATLASIGLAAPMTRLAGRRADAVRAILALSGIAIAGGALAGLVVSEHEPLFGFMEHGYRPAIIVAILLEVVTVVSLTAFLALTADGHA